LEGEDDEVSFGVDEQQQGQYVSSGKPTPITIKSLAPLSIVYDYAGAF
jgi:hypothetical protein